MRTERLMQRISQPTLYVAIGLVSLLTNDVNAGAWTGPEGAAYNKFGVNYFTSDEQFNRNNDKVDAGADFTDLNLTYYGEFGLRDDLSVFASAPYKSLDVDPVSGSSTDNSGVGDIDIGARFKLLEEDWGLVSVQGLVKIPEAYDENDALPLGNGQWDYEVRLLYGRSLWPRPFYFGLEGGYRWRSEAPSDELKYLVEVGYTASEKWSLRTKLDGTTSAKNADTSDASGNPTLAPDFDLAKLELTAGYAIRKDLFFEVTVTPTLWGRETAAGTTLSVALIYAIQPDN